MIIRKSWLPRDFVVFSILIFGVISLLTLGVAGISHQYGSDNLVSDSFQNNYNKLTEISGDVASMHSETKSGSGLSFIGTFNILFKSTFTVIALMWNVLDMYTGLASNFVADFTFLDAGVVQVFFLIGLLVLTTLLVFKWLSSVSQGKI